MATEPEQPEDTEEESRRMPSDLKTIGAIIRLLDKHDEQTAADIMTYIYNRSLRKGRAAL
jgi:hypothetical protein